MTSFLRSSLCACFGRPPLADSDEAELLPSEDKGAPQLTAERRAVLASASSGTAFSRASSVAAQSEDVPGQQTRAGDRLSARSQPLVLKHRQSSAISSIASSAVEPSLNSQVLSATNAAVSSPRRSHRLRSSTDSLGRVIGGGLGQPDDHEGAGGGEASISGTQEDSFRCSPNVSGGGSIRLSRSKSRGSGYSTLRGEQSDLRNRC